MDNIKSAEEILDAECGKYVAEESAEWAYIRPEVIDAMNIHAAQFQPKWIEGLPEPNNLADCNVLLSDGIFTVGWYDPSRGIWETNSGNYAPAYVLAYSNIFIAPPPIPDHLKAKIK